MARLLIVEDDADLRGLLELLFESEGHSTSSTASGLAALERVASEPFDLVVLDVDLDDLAGEAVTGVVRDLGRVPLVAISARRGTRWQRELLRAGATACLPKPYSFDSLSSLVAAILRSGGHEEGYPTDVRRLSAEELSAIARLSSGELDALPFGAIGIGPGGRIVEFNAYEEGASSYSRPTVVGMRFIDVAPCASVVELGGKIESALEGQALDHVLRFVFPRFGASSVVSVRLFRDEVTGRVWVFVSERPGLEGEVEERAELERAEPTERSRTEREGRAPLW
jgi:photoactive yellow protein